MAELFRPVYEKTVSEFAGPSEPLLTVAVKGLLDIVTLIVFYLGLRAPGWDCGMRFLF